MDYDNFLSLSQKALDLGCTIVKEYLDQGRVYNSLAPSTKIPQYTHKAYITPTYLTLVNQSGYKLS